MTALFPILAVLVAGIALAVQAPTNAALGRATGSVILAALTSFVIGTMALAAAWAMLDRTPPTLLRQAPVWTLAGGVYGALVVAAMAFAAPRLGLATALGIAIASQLVTAAVIDHRGWLGMPVDTLTPAKLLGVAMMLVGVVLVRRG